MLADDDCLMIPYQIGDVFISHSQEETQEMLEDAKVCGNLASGKDFQVGKFIITENA
jgi:hypothetical protein